MQLLSLADSFLLLYVVELLLFRNLCCRSDIILGKVTREEFNPVAQVITELHIDVQHVTSFVFQRMEIFSFAGRPPDSPQDFTSVVEHDALSDIRTWTSCIDTTRITGLQDVVSGTSTLHTLQSPGRHETFQRDNCMSGDSCARRTVTGIQRLQAGIVRCFRQFVCRPQ